MINIFLYNGGSKPPPYTRFYRNDKLQFVFHRLTFPPQSVKKEEIPNYFSFSKKK